jgi:protoporphyrinogen oxidase
MFLTYKNGMSILVERLTEELKSIQIIKGKGVEEVFKMEYGYEILLKDDIKLQADSPVVALPTQQAATLLPDVKYIDIVSFTVFVDEANRITILHKMINPFNVDK